MQPLQILMIISSTALVLSTLLLLVIRTMPTRKGLCWWIGASSLQAVAYFLAILFYGEERVLAGDIIFFTLQTVVNHFLIIGTLFFIKSNIKTNLHLWLLIPSVTLMAVCTLLALGQQFLGELLFSLENSVAFAIAAISIFKSKSSDKSSRTMGVLYCLVAIHWLDYPFIAHNPLYETVGFVVGLVLGVGVFLTMTLMALLQFRSHTKRSEARAIYSANHDSLTGLYNRNSLEEIFDCYKEKSEKSNHAFVLLYLDLDGFKAVNDQFGHKSGDLLLVTVAKRLEKWLGGKGDAIRIGGDEIVVFCRLRGMYSVETCYKTARLLLDSIELPIVDGQNIHKISASIGGCSYQPGKHTPTLDEMISCSDKQMYKAKQAGGHCIFLKGCSDAEMLEESMLHVKAMEQRKQKNKRLSTPPI